VAKACELHKAAKLHDASHLAAVHRAKLRVATLVLLLLRALLLLLLRGRRQACISSRTTQSSAL
jgi:hypothetical protein